MICDVFHCMLLSQKIRLKNKKLVVRMPSALSHNQARVNDPNTFTHTNLSYRMHFDTDSGRSASELM